MQKKLLQRLELWMEISEQHNNQHPLSPVTPTTFKQISDVDNKILPEFPLIPASRGFCITLRKTLATFKEVLINENIIERNSDTHGCENLKEQTKNENYEANKIADNNIVEHSSKKRNEENCKLTPNGNLSKDRVSSSSTNICSTPLSETKKTTSDHTIS